MKNIVLKRLSFEQMSALLRSYALMVQTQVETHLVQYDMEIVIESIEEDIKMMGEFSTHIGIRERGVEHGTKQHVEERMSGCWVELAHIYAYTAEDGITLEVEFFNIAL